MRCTRHRICSDPKLRCVAVVAVLASIGPQQLTQTALSLLLDEGVFWGQEELAHDYVFAENSTSSRTLFVLCAQQPCLGSWSHAGREENVGLRSRQTTEGDP